MYHRGGVVVLRHDQIPRAGEEPMSIIAPDGKPDAIEFCPGGRPTGLSSESSEAIAALLGRVAADIKAD